MTFGEPDFGKFPCLRLAFEAGEAGDSYPAVLNAANEHAVELFLDGKVTFTQIHELVERCLEAHEAEDVNSVDVVMRVDGWARGLVDEMAAQL